MSGKEPETVAVPVAEETLIVTKQDVETARVRVSLKTETLQDVVRETLRGRRVEVERVPIGREVDHMLESRVEGDVLVIPVVEEILVVEKRLVLKEEVRLRYVSTTEALEYPLTRRSQSATIERVEAGEADHARSALQDPTPTPADEGKPSMTRILTGLFDTRQEADAVVEHLLQHDGIDRSHVRVYAVDADTASDYRTTDDKGFWASLKDLFVPDEERATYTEGLRRGGVVVSAEVPEQLLDHASDVFESHGAVDLDAREAEWRNQGWSDTTHGLTTGDTTTSLPQSPTAPGTMGTMPAAMPSADTASAVGTARDNGEEVIPIVEEQIRIGKRDTEHGRVRVRSYVVETPVSEDVTLREEHVDVQRRPVDRPVSDADRMFEERTIEATEHGEEAVVAKEARVKEEVVIRKSATEHTETVKDTVRHTEVDVDDSRTPASTTPTTPPRNPI